MWGVTFNPGLESPGYQYFAPLGLSIGVCFLEFNALESGAWNSVLVIGISLSLTTDHFYE